MGGRGLLGGRARCHAFPLSAKLMGAEKNDAKAWLPASAESTKVLDVQSRFQSPNVYPGVVVYYRPSGLTAADRAKAAADARKFAGIPGAVAGQVVGPIPSADGQALQTILQVNLGAKGYADANKAVDAIHAITNSNANGLVSHVTGPLGNAADSNNVFKGIAGTLLYSAVAVVILILLITYRSPVLWLLPVISSGVALIVAQAVIYLLAAHAGLTVNGQSAGILEVLVFGASTDYALLIVARYREELRRHDRRHAGDGHRAAPRGPGDHRQRRDRRSGAADAVRRGAELDQEPGAGAGHRRRGRHVRHDHPAARAAGDLPPGGLLAVPAGLRLGRADAPGDVGAGRLGHRPPAADHMDHHRVILGVLALGLTGLKANGLTNAQGFRGHPDSVPGESVLAAHFPAGAGQPVIVIGNAGAAAALRSAFAAPRGSRP